MVGGIEAQDQILNVRQEPSAPTGPLESDPRRTVQASSRPGKLKSLLGIIALAARTQLLCYAHSRDETRADLDGGMSVASSGLPFAEEFAQHPC